MRWFLYAFSLGVGIALGVIVFAAKESGCAGFDCPQVECWGRAPCAAGCPCSGWSPSRPGVPGWCG